MKRRQATLLWTLVPLATIIVPIVGVVVIVLGVPNTLRSADRPPAPLSMPVTTSLDAQEQAVQASLIWSTPVTLSAPDWTGLVTAVVAHPGEAIQSGSEILQLNGVSIVALKSSLPFFRAIGTGTTGPDVTALRLSLSALGIQGVGAGTTFDPALEVAIKEFQVRYQGASAKIASGTFDPNSVIYLPQTSVVVGSIAATVGLPAAAEGQPIVSGNPVLRPFTLTDVTTGSASAQLPSSSTGYEFEVQGGPTIPVGPGFVVSDPSVLQSVAGMLGRQSAQLAGQIRLVTPRQYSSVPTSAVVTDAGGGTCVYPYGGGRIGEPISVAVSGGLPGQTEVSELAGSIQSVLADPAAVGKLGC